MTEQKVNLPNGVTLERAKIKDVSKIVDLLATVQIDTYANVTPDLTEEVVRKHAESKKFQRKIRRRNILRIIHPRRALWIAKSGEEIVGFASAEIRKGKHWNSGLYVAISQQGEGIGTAFMEERKRWHGPVDIYLNVVPKTPAVNFHKSFGFKPTGIEPASIYENGQTLPLIEMRLAAQDQHRALRR